MLLLKTDEHKYKYKPGLSVGVLNKPPKLIPLNVGLARQGVSKF